MRALRPTHWLKNVLVAAAPALAHRLHEPEVALQTALAFAALSLVASGTYVVNDLLDRERDRQHPTKRHRPFASGALSPAFGRVLGPAFVAAGFGVGALLGVPFVGALALYVGATLAYSLRLKRIALVDVFLLAGLYALRVFAGGAATGIAVSAWLLAFSLFLFLGLAMLKRYAELRILERAEAEHLLGHETGRGYAVGDAALLRAIGPAVGFLAVLVITLYVNGATVGELYARPDRLWLVAPLLAFWTMHLWLMAHRGTMTDEPVAFAIRDRTSYVVAALTGAVLVAASLP